MNINTKQIEISIVVNGSFYPMEMSPKWMFERGVVSNEEWDALSETIMISPQASKFSFGDMEFACLGNKIQVCTSDISKSNRIKQFVVQLFECLESPTIRAVGINGEYKFSFFSLEDSLRFARYLSNINSMSYFIGEAELKKIVFEDSVEASAENPHKTITIQPKGEEIKRVIKNGVVVETKKNTVYSLYENNHFVVSEKEELFCCLARAEKLQMDFCNNVEKTIKAI